MSFMITDNPVWDAECYYVSQMDTRPVIGYCSECQDELHGKEPGMDADVVYMLDDGSLLCGRCKRRFIDRAERQVMIGGCWVPEEYAEQVFEDLYRL